MTSNHGSALYPVPILNLYFCQTHRNLASYSSVVIQYCSIDMHLDSCEVTTIMTMTDDDIPGISPVHQGDSSASLPANVGIPIGTRARMSEKEEGESVDNYDLTLGDNDDYSLSEKMVHYCGGGHILPVHWSACKAVLAFYAGSKVSKSKSLKIPEMGRACLEIYYNAIEELDVAHFNDKDSREFFHCFQKKEEPVPAHSLW